jgi:hypothetical protein
MVPSRRPVSPEVIITVIIIVIMHVHVSRLQSWRIMPQHFSLALQDAEATFQLGIFVFRHLAPLLQDCAICLQRFIFSCQARDLSGQLVDLINFVVQSSSFLCILLRVAARLDPLSRLGSRWWAAFLGWDRWE